MPTPILMPALSPTMEQGKLSKWLKKEGDKVASGDAIAEIETDKATMEVEAVDEGTIGKIMIPEGTEGVAVNTPIAVLLSEGEDASAISEVSIPSPQPSPPGRGSLGAAVATSSPLPGGEGQGEGKDAHSNANGHSRIFASPLARRLAAQSGIDLSRLRGSGPHGRIVKHDVDEAVRSGTAADGLKPLQWQRRLRKTAARLCRAASSRRRCPTIRSSRSTRRAATRSVRSTICAKPSRRG